MGTKKTQRRTTVFKALANESRCKIVYQHTGRLVYAGMHGRADERGALENSDGTIPA